MAADRARRRLFLGAWLVALVWVGFLVRFAQFMLLDAPNLRVKAEEHQFVRQPIEPARGEIYHRGGEVLVSNLTRWSLWGNGRDVVKFRRAVEMAAAAGGDSPDAVRRRFESMPKGYGCLVREVLHPEALRPGLAARYGMEIRATHQRLYPENALACHVLGMLGRDGAGLEGAELSLDETLGGKPGWALRLRDGAGGYYAAPGLAQQDPVPGRDIMLTLDRGIQELAELVLAQAVERWNALGGTVVVVEPKRGDLLALANWPRYDPLRPADAPEANRRNRAVTDLYEPGSTMKLVLAAALLDRGLMVPEDMVYAEQGRLALRHGSVSDTHNYGWLTFRQSFVLSSNIAFFKLASQLAPAEFYRWMRDFGFGAATGVDLPGEVRGSLRQPSRWSDRSQGTIAFGQEIAVTPLQMAMAYAAVANGGVLMQPRVVKALRDPATGEWIETAPSARRRIVKPETAARLVSFMEGVVEEGTGKQAQMAGVRVAGKTGTSEKADLAHGGYKKGAYTPSFIGFAPADDPQFVCLVMLDEPRGGYYGGTVAAPAFKALTERLLMLPEARPAPAGRPADEEGLRRLFVRDGAPDGEAGVVTAELAGRHLEHTVDAAAYTVRRLRDEAERHRAAAGDSVTSRAGRARTAEARAEGSAPDTASFGPRLPDLTGMTIREARRALHKLGVAGDWTGSGVVVAQTPPPDTPVTPGLAVRVEARLRPEDDEPDAPGRP